MHNVEIFSLGLGDLGPGGAGDPGWNLRSPLQESVEASLALIGPGRFPGERSWVIFWQDLERSRHFKQPGQSI